MKSRVIKVTVAALVLFLVPTAVAGANEGTNAHGVARGSLYSGGDLELSVRLAGMWNGHPAYELASFTCYATQSGSIWCGPDYEAPGPRLGIENSFEGTHTFAGDADQWSITALLNGFDENGVPTTDYTMTCSGGRDPLEPLFPGVIDGEEPIQGTCSFS